MCKQIFCELVFLLHPSPNTTSVHCIHSKVNKDDTIRLVCLSNICTFSKSLWVLSLFVKPLPCPPHTRSVVVVHPCICISPRRLHRSWGLLPLRPHPLHTHTHTFLLMQMRAEPPESPNDDGVNNKAHTDMCDGHQKVRPR